MNWISLEPGSWADWFSGIASATAVIVALSGYFLSERSRKKDIRERELDAAHQIGIKLHALVNDAHSFYAHLTAPYEGPVLGVTGQPRQRWREVQPLVGVQDGAASVLSPTEQNLLIRMGKGSFLGRLQSAIATNQAVCAAMKEFLIRRDSLFEMTPPPKQIDGLHARHELTTEQMLTLAPYSNALEQLIISTSEMAEKNYRVVTNLCNDYRPMMKVRFPKEKFITFSELPK